MKKLHKTNEERFEMPSNSIMTIRRGTRAEIQRGLMSGQEVPVTQNKTKRLGALWEGIKYSREKTITVTNRKLRRKMQASETDNPRGKINLRKCSAARMKNAKVNILAGPKKNTSKSQNDTTSIHII